jgi:hypothetical protein
MNWLFVGLLLILGAIQADHADAGVYFSRQHSLPCSQCHTKIPLLNEAGQEFKSNGYSLEKRAPNPKDALPISQAGPAEPIVPSVTPTREKAVEAVSIPKMPPPPPPKTEYLYRSELQDGTVVFSDNPLHQAGKRSSAPELNINKTAAKSRKDPVVAVAARKPISGGLMSNKRHKKNDRPIETAGKRQTGGSAPVASQPTGLVAKAHPHNYQDCMEKILIKSEQPKSGAEAMAQFERAERSCTPDATPH